jgi:hypothetical protein
VIQNLATVAIVRFGVAARRKAVSSGRDGCQSLELLMRRRKSWQRNLAVRLNRQLQPFINWQEMFLDNDRNGRTLNVIIMNDESPAVDLTDPQPPLQQLELSIRKLAYYYIDLANRVHSARRSPLAKGGGV